MLLCYGRKLFVCGEFEPSALGPHISDPKIVGIWSSVRLDPELPISARR